MHDGEIGQVEHRRCQREVLGAHLPERGNQAVDHGMTEQPSDCARLGLQGGPIGLGIAPSEGETADEVVQDELVQNDDGRHAVLVAAHELEDPAVRVRVVADVVNGYVDPAR